MCTPAIKRAVGMTRFVSSLKDKQRRRSIMELSIVLTTLLVLASIMATTQAAQNVDYYNDHHKQQRRFVSSSAGTGGGIVNAGASANTPRLDERNTQTLRNELEVQGDGNYHYAYETSNGISAEEYGQGGVAVQGSSSYTSPEGIEIKTSYIADETGYHPVGDHIPKIPDYILRALEYIRAHPYQVKDYYSGETKPVSHDHEAFKTVTRNSFARTRTTPVTTRRTTPTTQSSFQRLHPRSIKIIGGNNVRRGSIKYYNTL